MTAFVMDPQEHFRSFEPDLSVKPGGDGRTVYGIAVPWGVVMQIDESLREQWARGAFDHQLRDPRRVKFEREHVPLGGTLIGAGSMMRNDAAGLYVELHTSKTPIGDETLELVRDGALNELSIHFRERQNRRLAGNVVERVQAQLKAVAIVMEGAYGELAAAGGVRSGRGFPVSPTDAGLMAKAEPYLLGLPPLPDDHDLEIRALRLGLGVPPQ
jgi:uncharacterized protein